MSFPSRSTVIRSASLWISSKPVGDIDDPPVLALQLPHQGEKGFDVVGVQGAGRLVHDEDARIQPDGLGDLDELLHGNGEVLDERG